jgi:hypothetical protein
LEALEKELGMYRSTLRKIHQKEAHDSRQLGSDGDDSDVEEASGKEGTRDGVLLREQVPARLTDRIEGSNLQSGMGEQIERMQVGKVLDACDLEEMPPLEDRLFHENQTTETALKIHGAPETCLADLLSVLPSRDLCDVLVSHFYNDLNWIRQPWPRDSLCQSFSAFWSTGPTLTANNLNTFALLCSLCAIARMTIEHIEFSSDANARKLEARRLHFTSRSALMLSSIFNQENLDQIIAWTLACRFLLLEKRYGEAYTCAARTVKAAYSIDLHRDGRLQGKSREVTEARRKVWSAVYYFDRNISILTGRPPAIDDRYCDVGAPSEAGDWGSIYTPRPQGASAAQQPAAQKKGEPRPTPYAYCVQRQKISKLQGQMIATLLYVHATSTREKRVALIDQELQAIKSTFPLYLRVELVDGVELQIDKSLDKVYGFLPIQRYLLHSEINALCIGLHRPFLLATTSNQEARSLNLCLNAALFDIALYKDFRSSHHSSISPLVLEVYVGSHRWFHAVLLCGIVLLAHSKHEKSAEVLAELNDFVDSSRRGILTSSARREIQIIEIFLQEHSRRNAKEKRRESRPESILTTTEGDGRQAKRPRTNQSSAHDTDEGRQLDVDPLLTHLPGDLAETTATPSAQELLNAWYAQSRDDAVSTSHLLAAMSSDDASQVFGSALRADVDSGALQKASSCDLTQPPTRANSSAETLAPYDQDPSSSNDLMDGDFWLSLINKL